MSAASWKVPPLRTRTLRICPSLMLTHHAMVASGLTQQLLAAGFRTGNSTEGADQLAALPGSLEPGGHVGVDSARSASGSRSRQNSGLLRRRSGSYKPQRGAGKPDLAEGRAPSLHAIYASTSLGERALPQRPCHARSYHMHVPR